MNNYKFVRIYKLYNSIKNKNIAKNTSLRMDSNYPDALSAFCKYSPCNKYL